MALRAAKSIFFLSQGGFLTIILYDIRKRHRPAIGVF
jgi:hypothetical protein